MKEKPNTSLRKNGEQPFVGEYVVTVTPHTWWGRVILTAVLAVLLSGVFLFFSLLIAVGAAIIALAILIGMLKYPTGSSSRPGR
ncbi:MAG: hypothetical protein P8011_01200 [Acidihalobacter sp.]|jgi:uncharacterized membrane protein|uniref:hypothetical protein n=1 Tax=Acidihalobacter sp. TaxID=1872108 RepID=UPI00307F58B0